MRVLVTGSSKGIGLAVAQMFLDKGHVVIGMDLLAPAIFHSNYIHYQLDVSKKEHFLISKALKLSLATLVHKIEIIFLIT